MSLGAAGDHRHVTLIIPATYRSETSCLPGWLIRPRSIAARTAGRATSERLSPRLRSKLVVIKVVHTAVWAFFAACIVAVPFVALAGQLRGATVLSVVVLGEVVVLVLNGMRCPLTDVAQRYTDDRRDNFDIYLPLWLARKNKRIFGALFVAGEVLLVWCWLR